MNFRRSIIIAQLWRPEIARRWKNLFSAFCWKNDPLREIFPNSVPKGFIAAPIDVLCSNFAKFGRREIGKIMRCLCEFSLAVQLSRYCVDRVQNLPGQTQRMYSHCSRFHPNRFTFSGVIFERLNTARSSSKVNPMFGLSLSLSQIITGHIKCYYTMSQKASHFWLAAIFTHTVRLRQFLVKMLPRK